MKLSSRSNTSSDMNDGDVEISGNLRENIILIHFNDFSFVLPVTAPVKCSNVAAIEKFLFPLDLVSYIFNT